MAIAAPPVPRRRTKPVAVPGLEVRRMSFADYMRLPEKPKAEWLDGWAVIHMAPPQYPHFKRAGRLIALLSLALPGLDVGPEGPFHPDIAMFVPDIVAVKPVAGNEKWITLPPELIVEIHSPSTRKYDLTTKLNAYLELGVGQYWTVDTDKKEIVVRENAGANWNNIGKLDAAHPNITVKVGDYGEVTLNRGELFR